MGSYSNEYKSEIINPALKQYAGNHDQQMQAVQQFSSQYKLENCKLAATQ
jgi:hypothetical protein